MHHFRKDQDSTNAEYGELYAETMNLNSKFPCKSGHFKNLNFQLMMYIRICRRIRRVKKFIDLN